jgi:hypothetical protein
MRTWTVGTVSGPRIGSVLFETQEIRFHQRVKHQLAHRLFNAAQTLHLCGFQTQTRHFQILGTEMVEHVFNCSHDGNLFEMKQTTLEASSPTPNPGHDAVPSSISADVANRSMSQNRTDFNGERKKSNDTKHREG